MAFALWGAVAADARTVQQTLDAACARDIAALGAEAGIDAGSKRAC